MKKEKKKERKQPKSAKVFVISDTHFPFQDKRAYKQMLKELKKEHKAGSITHIVQVGDLLDQYIFSRFDRSPDVTFETDVERGLKDAHQMWRDVKKICPRAKCYQLLGNHDIRVNKKIANKLPELAHFFKLEDYYTFPGVKTLPSPREWVEIDGVVYTHGHLSKSIDHAKQWLKPVVHGHIHRPSITYENPQIWSMSVGFLADRDSMPLNYTATRLNKWTLACGVVENGHPRLIILE